MFGDMSVIRHISKHGLAATRAIFNRYGLGSNPAVLMLLCPWKRHLAMLSPAWRFTYQKN